MHSDSSIIGFTEFVTCSADSFIVGDVMLHSPSKMTVSATNGCVLKWRTLDQYQEDLKHVKYIIINGFLIIGQRMLG